MNPPIPVISTGRALDMLAEQIEGSDDEVYRPSCSIGIICESAGPHKALKVDKIAGSQVSQNAFPQDRFETHDRVPLGRWSAATCAGQMFGIMIDGENQCLGIGLD
jgi:hypothetical protein